LITVFINEKNNPSWDDKYNWSTLGKLGRDLGLYWGGDWGWDKPHFQFIPATVSEQAKIIKGEYPEFDNKVNEYLEKFFPHFEKIKVNNYSDSIIKQTIEFYDTVFNPPTKSFEKISIADDLINNNLS